jgi:hypothetical protein
LIRTSAISPSSFKAWSVSLFNSSSFSNSIHLFFDMTRFSIGFNFSFRCTIRPMTLLSHSIN